MEHYPIVFHKVFHEITFEFYVTLCYDKEKLLMRWAMKKILLGISQIIVFLALYEIVLTVFSYGLSYIYYFILQIPILKYWFAMTTVHDTITYTFLPIASGLGIVCLFNLIYRKYRVQLVPALCIFAVISYAVINTLINTIITYGLISWDTANSIWYDVILCGILFFGIYSKIDTKKVIVE